MSDDAANRWTAVSDNRYKVGQTLGLVNPHDASIAEIEQAYVWIDKEASARHPISLEGWCGYGVEGRLRLTKRQAVDLIGLLAEAVGRV